MSKYLGRISTNWSSLFNLRELNPMSTSTQNVLLDQNISNSLETRDHPQVKWKLGRTNEPSASQKLLPNFYEHPNCMHFYLDHDEILGHEMILKVHFSFIWVWFGSGMVKVGSGLGRVKFGSGQVWVGSGLLWPWFTWLALVWYGFGPVSTIHGIGVVTYLV